MLSKPVEEFGNNKNNFDGKQSYCKECGRQKDRKNYLCGQNRKQKIRASAAERKRRNYFYVQEYLKNHPCVDCGEDDASYLEFDHVRGTKSANVSSMVHQCFSLENIQAEIDKCEIRCIKCHRNKTVIEEGWYSFLPVSDNGNPPHS